MCRYTLRAACCPQVLRTAYLLRERTPAELRPVPAEWQPLPPGPTYTDFKGFPEGKVGRRVC